jgi:hypothetical protein
LSDTKKIIFLTVLGLAKKALDRLWLAFEIVAIPRCREHYLRPRCPERYHLWITFPDNLVKFFNAGDEKSLVDAMLMIIRYGEMRKKLVANASALYSASLILLFY